MIISAKANVSRINLLSSTALGRAGLLSIMLAAAPFIPSPANAAGLLVPGDTTWTGDHTINGNLVIRGGTGGATLTIKDGAKVESTNGYIADGRGSVGTVVVSGPGSTWNIVDANPNGYRALFVGGFENGIYGGKGTLIIENGGTVSAKETYVGSLQEGDGTLVVRGAGSILSTDYLGVADGAMTLNTAAVRIENGGLVNSRTAYFENGTVLVTGENSRWVNSGELTIGDSLTIEQGAVVSTNTAVLQEDESVDTIQAYVDGAGSELKVTDKLTIGDSGRVNLSVANGGKLSAGGGIVLSGIGGINNEGMGSLTIGGKVDLNNIAEPIARQAQAAGTVDPAAKIDFGPRRGYVNFNHTNAGYEFANTIGGKGTISNFSGETIVSGDLTKFYGKVNVSGGKLVLKSNLDRIDNDPDTGITDYSETRFEVTGGTLIVDGETGRVEGDRFYTNEVDVFGEMNRIRDPNSTSFGRLGGSGTVGDTYIDSKAIISPGNSSTGTLTVMGRLDMATGSIYEADIAGDGRSDRIVVKSIGTNENTGIAKIGSGTNVQVTALDANTSYKTGQTYTILTADRAIEGQFAEAISKSAFLEVSLDQKEKQVDLKIKVKNGGTEPKPGEPKPGEPKPGEPKPGEPKPGEPKPGEPEPGVFEGEAATGNQRQAALALNTLGQSGPSLGLYNALILLDGDAARRAFDLLSGEVHASAQTALINDSSLLRNAANDRIRAAFDDVAAADVPVLAYGPEDKITTGAVGAINAASVGRPAMAGWGQVFGSWTNTDGNGNAGALDQSTGGFVTGFDAAVSDNALIGIMAAYSRTNFDVDSRASSGDSDNYHLGVYSGGRWGDVALRSGLAYTWHSINTARSVAFPGFTDQLKADYDAGTFQAFGEVGYRIDLPSVALEPFANLAYVSLHTDGFTERGAAAALSSRSNTTDTTFTTLGLRASAPLSLGPTDAKVRGMLGWQHAFGDTTPFSTMAFGTGSAFSVAGTPIAEDAAIIEAGIDFALTGNASLGITYTGQFGSGTTQNAVDAKLDVRF
ncbi:autotransporter domain-containing protein [Ensifer sesbaniae]|uniref:autotransporter family protein n=1 Tax=Ensifer sesbaniae TaxID=1214071 RepID=UPI00200178B5|nr:autotransporter domain-containing protein [Ensifer sesbaniae]